MGTWIYRSMSFLTSALVGGEWSASRPEPRYPQGRRPRYPLDRRLGEPESRSRLCGEDDEFSLVGFRAGADSDEFKLGGAA
jgi:hypothetical protein